MSTVAFLGLGAMGQRMATNLLTVGHELYVWNRTSERCTVLIEQGAILCASPREAAENADIVVAMLTDDEASRAVWLDKKTGAMLGLRRNSIAIECSTLSLDWCLELAASIRENGAEFLDAPVVGSRPQAESRQLIHLAGGETEVLEQVRDILNASAGTIQHIGSIGSGMSMKLAVNGLFGIQVAALAEILSVLHKAGISLELSVSLLNELPMTSPALKGIGALIVAEKFAPLFPIDLVEKDFGYLTHLADSLNSEIPSVIAARNVYQKAKISGYGKENIAGVVKLYR